MTKAQRRIEAALSKVARDQSRSSCAFHARLITMRGSGSVRLPHATAKQAVRELNRLAVAVAELDAAAAMSVEAVDYLEQARADARAEWSVSAPHALRLMLNQHWPGLADVARRGARLATAGPSTRGRRPAEIERAVAAACAAAYHALSGREPTRQTATYGEGAGADVGEFHQLLSEVFSALDLSGSPATYARWAVDSRQDAAG